MKHRDRRSRTPVRNLAHLLRCRFAQGFRSLSIFWGHLRTLHLELPELRAQFRVHRRSMKSNRTGMHYNFPESDHPIMRLLLFGFCMIPTLGKWLRDTLWRRRAHLRHDLQTKLSRLDRFKAHPLKFLGGALLIGTACFAFSLYSVGTTVSYDGQEIATVDNRLVAHLVLDDVEELTAETLHETYTVDKSLIHYSDHIVSRSEIEDSAQYQEELTEALGEVAYGYTLMVDGEAIGTTPYEGALEDLLEQLVAVDTDENTISIGFAEDVEVVSGYVASEQLVNLGFIAEKLSSTKSGEVNYTIVKGDTWSEIASEHGLTNSELLALNPGYNINSLSIGEVLTISNAVPYLTITEVERQSYTEDISYSVEYQDDPSLYEGTYKVLSKGEYGKADVVANVTYVNGEETAREIISSVTTLEPVTEIQARGTKERPSWYPTGSFQRPATGRITSYFGYRNLSYKAASHNHQGVDIANSKGTPIYAADGGVVIFSGWQSGYGYLVKIDHQNGFVTYYGHNSQNLVSVGQKVYKGQQIAKMGSTGNSTGNHCHFEVRYNGVARNPLNYIS